MRPLFLARFVPEFVKQTRAYGSLVEAYYDARRRFGVDDLREYQAGAKIGSDSNNAWIRKSSEIEGWLFEGEPELLWSLATTPGEGDVLEIGTWQGKSTCILAGACIESHPNSRVFCIDTFMMDGDETQLVYHRRLVKQPGTFYQFLENAKRLGFISHVILLASFSEKILPHLNVKVRLAFIDGAHDRDSVVRDIELVKPLVGTSGIIALHDSSEHWPGVGEAIDASLRSDAQFEFHGKVHSLECWRRVGC